ncbi:hypothetical protein AAE02nite_50930 [Adhaeribacter aerolatus]|uniref:Uncharacterized protein n=1 Tax=Adhaeribacter aerolatus TaxID=670289 RepID=A0A512B645_9BACT|nr:hypothetical protein AAE02nite_50930 [Adhaeribacter aerolatus]
MINLGCITLYKLKIEDKVVTTILPPVASSAFDFGFTNQNKNMIDELQRGG